MVHANFSQNDVFTVRVLHGPTTQRPQRDFLLPREKIVSQSVLLRTKSAAYQKNVVNDDRSIKRLSSSNDCYRYKTVPSRIICPAAS